LGGDYRYNGLLLHILFLEFTFLESLHPKTIYRNTTRV